MDAPATSRPYSSPLGRLARVRLERLPRAVIIDHARLWCRVPWAQTVMDLAPEQVRYLGLFDLTRRDRWWPGAVVWVPHLHREDALACCVYYRLSVDGEVLGALDTAYHVRQRPPWAYYLGGGDPPGPPGESPG